MRVAVAGGTGLVGRLVVAGLAASGDEPVVLARSTGVDLLMGAGTALDDCDAVVDVDLGYYAGKRRQEEVVRGGGVPWTVLRATQFHEFAGQLVRRSTGRLVVVPSMLSRPVAAQEVAARLVDLVRARPVGAAEPVAGPRTMRLVDMVRGYLRATGERRLVVPLRLPGRAARAAASGALVPAEPFVRGTETFEQYLAGLRTARAPRL